MVMERRWLLLITLWPLLLQAQSLPLNRTLYRIEITNGSYTCKLTEEGYEYDCKAWPAPTPWMELHWNSQAQAYELHVPRQINYAYTTVPSNLYVDNQCRFTQASWEALHRSFCEAAAPFGGCSFYDPFLQAWPLYTFYCPYDPQLPNMWAVWLSDFVYPINLGPQRLSRVAVDYDPDRDGIVNEPGYPYLSDSRTLALYLFTYHHDKRDLKYAAIITQTSSMRWLDVLLFTVRAEGNLINPVAAEPAPNFTQSPIDVYPNPAHEALYIRFTLDRPTSVALGLYDLLGRPVYEQSTQPYPPGTHQLTIHRGSWPAGPYLLRLTLGQQHYTQTVIWP